MQFMTGDFGGRRVLHMQFGTRQQQTKLGAQTGRICIAAFLPVSLALVVAGCAIMRGGAPSHLYQGSLVEVRRLDTSSLRGRRIVLDPGHGGAFPGAIGRDGLKEADVNLGVALYLWGMLRDAGAEVLLTRSSDVDFLGEEKASLRDDLMARVDVALAFEPELFVSLHHNADMFRSRKRNQTETYFKMLDDGPSRDVARYINRRLTESLGIQKSAVVPGNYFVLRNMRCIAVLCEPSYLSNPLVERKLRLAEKQLLEAQAYFLGILDYFSRGVPVVASLSPRDTVVEEGLPALAAVLRSDRFPTDASKSPIDTSSVTVRVDGLPVARIVESYGEFVKGLPEKPLASGEHELCVSCRNLNGNSSSEVCSHFHVSLPPRSLFAGVSPDCISGKGGVLITALSKDENGNPVIDGSKVEFSSGSGVFSSDSVTTIAGVATSVFFPNDTTTDRNIKIKSRGPSDSLVLTDSLLLEPCPATRRFDTQAIRVVADDTGEALWNAQLGTWDGDSLLGLSSPQGLIVFDAERTGRAILTARGYLPAPVRVSFTTAVANIYGRHEIIQTSIGTGDLMTIRMKPAASGVLRNAKIVIDLGQLPGDEERAGSSDPNNEPRETQFQKERLPSEVAQRLRNMLSGAGAQVLVLGEKSRDEEKVKAAELFGARTYLRIEGSSKKSCSLLHYPGSTAGTNLAQQTARWWTRVLKVKEPSIREDAQYVLRQTSCPALVAILPASNKRVEGGLASLTAYALYLGILEDSGVKGDELAQLTVSAADNSPRQNPEVVMDDFTSLPVAEGQSATFFCEEGTHLVRATSERGSTEPEFVSLKKGTQTSLQLSLR